MSQHKKKLVIALAVLCALALFLAVLAVTLVKPVRVDSTEVGGTSSEVPEADSEFSEGMSIGVLLFLFFSAMSLVGAMVLLVMTLTAGNVPGGEEPTPAPLSRA